MDVQDLARWSGMSNTSFIRTSEERHYTGVKHFWVSSYHHATPIDTISHATYFGHNHLGVVAHTC